MGTQLAQEATRLVDNEVIDVAQPSTEQTQAGTPASSSQGDSQPKAWPTPPPLPAGTVKAPPMTPAKISAHRACLDSLS